MPAVENRAPAYTNEGIAAGTSNSYTRAMTKKKLIIIIVSSATLLAVGALCNSLVRNNTAPRTQGLTRIEGYRDAHGGVSCAAMTPGCGLCYGIVVDGSCYVDEAKLSAEERHLMGLQ